MTDRMLELFKNLEKDVLKIEHEIEQVRRNQKMLNFSNDGLPKDRHFIEILFTLANNMTNLKCEIDKMQNIEFVNPYEVQGGQKKELDNLRSQLEAVKKERQAKEIVLNFMLHHVPKN